MNSKLTAFYQRYEEILNQKSSPYEKDKQLAYLMSEMERVFRIPLMSDPQWERENRAIISLYLMISNSRQTL